MRRWAPLLVLVIAGCATPPPVLPPVDGPVGPDLALAPIQITYEATLDRGKGEPFYPPFQPRIEDDGLDDAVVRFLRERGAYASITQLSGDPEDWEEQEAAGGATKRLELEVDAVELRFIDTNGWQVPKVIIFVVCAVLIFPGIDPFNWFIPGEDFAIVATGRWSLHDLAGSDPPQRGRWERELARDSFATFGLGSIPSRPFFFAGFLRVPGCLEEDDWADIGEGLKSPSQLGLLHALVLESEERRIEIPGTPGG